MVTRRNAIDRLERTDTEDLPPEDLERLRARAEGLRRHTARELEDILDIEDPYDRIEALDFAAQLRQLEADEALERRDQLIFELVKSATEGPEVVARLSKLLFVSEPRVRQIVAAPLEPEQKRPQPVPRHKIKETLTAEYLTAEYVEARRTISDIARELGVTSQTVSNYLQRHGIPKRSRSNDWFSKELTAEYLQREYVENGRTTVDIAEEKDVTPQTIANYLEKHGIPIRSRGPRSD